ncbi:MULTISPECIES: hypothetical protein [unclassified Leisingera]|uniref:hypothetical protein n=1 Tax=unclassified Leisingera TaxID=2614906 RepID=UPI000560A9D5|nr:MULTISPECIES: hypothetical protein [unclassified Leisingera]KIC25771.1 hypothetical protein RA23_05440 [Leisingera sp. ANG-S3]KIC54813.1 hypothetical protein RA22_04610 [Leisingera sp. ANG-S]KID11132.1 hypothetical protein GC1_02660 [Leisingera sp. ANG1]
MTKTLFDLAKALVKATLILLALCLFLGWKLMAAAEGVTANAAAIADQAAPLRTAITGLQSDIAALRSSMQDGTVSSARLTQLEARVAKVQDSLADMRTLPQQAAAEAAREGAAELASRIISAAPLLKDGSACGPGES